MLFFAFKLYSTAYEMSGQEVRKKETVVYNFINVDYFFKKFLQCFFWPLNHSVVSSLKYKTQIFTESAWWLKPFKLMSSKKTFENLVGNKVFFIRSIVFYWKFEIEYIQSLPQWDCQRVWVCMCFLLISKTKFHLLKSGRMAPWLVSKLQQI